MFKAPLMLFKSLLQARRIVRELQPVCVLGLGGYVTGPGGLAARMAGVPLVISDPDSAAAVAMRSVADALAARTRPLCAGGNSSSAPG